MDTQNPPKPPSTDEIIRLLGINWDDKRRDKKISAYLRMWHDRHRPEPPIYRKPKQQIVRKPRIDEVRAMLKLGVLPKKAEEAFWRRDTHIVYEIDLKESPQVKREAGRARDLKGAQVLVRTLAGGKYKNEEREEVDHLYKNKYALKVKGVFALGWLIEEIIG